MARESSQMRRQLRAARDAIATGGQRSGAGSNGSGGDGRPPAEVRDLPSPVSAPRNGGRPRLKKLRLVVVLLGLSVLALVSWIFGIMMAVAQDLPKLENRQQYREAQNSVVVDRYGNRLATLTGNEQRILIESADISPTLKQAVVSIEDQRFYEHRGVDVMSIARAAIKDVVARGAVQGASTITQQFVKNALQAQQSRTIFQKLRESALAYHLEREWSKDKILTQYLNSIYFGEGAYGIEAAARTYFGSSDDRDDCGGEGDRCASQLMPHEAALLAGIIASPESYSPRANPEAALERRNLVLANMLEQGGITQDQYEDEIEQPLPAPSEITPPKEESEAPYFTSWLKQQVVDHYGAGQAFGGGLQIQSTLDLELQKAAEQAISDHLGGIAPTASVVVMDNATAGVLAMASGEDYDDRPFNLATNGQRQPGSAMKPFILATALEEGRSTAEVFSSEQKTFPVPGSKKELFEVHNYEDSYSGTTNLFDATTNSDNSVYAELGLAVGTKDIAETAKAMGIQTKISKNPAMTLGGLKRGVTPLEMTHAYLTLARDGQRVSGTLASRDGGPVGISTVKDADGDPLESNDDLNGQNKVETKRVLAPETAVTEKDVLETVVSEGTGTRAAYGGYAWGKTGTTENNGDAWFCGANRDITACVWVGHAEGNTPMETEYGGAPVDGGTFPALIWSEVISAFMDLKQARKPNKDPDSEDEDPVDESAAPAPAPEVAPPAAPAPAEPAPAPEAPAPEEQAPAEPAEPEPGPAGGGAGGGDGGADGNGAPEAGGVDG